MLKLVVPATEVYDEALEKFRTYPEKVLMLEHSLVSISKWESKWCKPYLNSQLTPAESRDYVRCMTLTQNVSDEIYERLSPQNIRDIDAYISAPMTATTITHHDTKKKPVFGKGQTVTSEVIYGWMVAFQIPVEFQKWHLNRLMMLIEVCNEQQNPKKKSKKETARDYSKLNAERRRKLGTKG